MLFKVRGFRSLPLEDQVNFFLILVRMDSQFFRQSLNLFDFNILLKCFFEKLKTKVVVKIFSLIAIIYSVKNIFEIEFVLSFCNIELKLF